MAIQTIKATIQMRQGAEQDFDPTQMTAGEWAVATDSKKVWMCFRPGLVLRMATYEAFEQDMREIQLILATCQDIQTAVERFMQLAQQHASKSEEWSVASQSWAVGGTGIREGEDVNNSEFWSNQSKAEADRAKNEADRAASIAGFDIDSELSETSTNPVQNKVITNALENVDISNKEIQFEEAAERSNILSGEKLPVLFGKIKKWFADLKPVAFLNPTNNLLATVAGTSLDAVQGKALDGKITLLNNNLTNKIDEINGNLGKEYTADAESVSCANGNSTVTGARLVVPAGVYAISASAIWENGTNNLNGYRRVFVVQGDFYNSDGVTANDAAGCRSIQVQSCCGLFVSTGNSVLRVFLLQANTSSAEITAKNIRLLAVKIK